MVWIVSRALTVSSLLSEDQEEEWKILAGRGERSDTGTERADLWLSLQKESVRCTQIKPTPGEEFP